MRWLGGIIDSMDMSLSKLQEIVEDREAWVCCSPWGHKVLDTTEQLHNNNKIYSIKSKNELCCFRLFYDCQRYLNIYFEPV